MTYASDQAVLNAQWNAAVEAQQTETERRRPSVLFRPALMLDGDAWCALYGVNLQEGLAAFGRSPDEAMRAFDKMWLSQASTAIAAEEAREDAARNGQFGVGA